ncbi:embryonic protein UVS.2-like [Neosynchiropus ocellatus]
MLLLLLVCVLAVDSVPFNQTRDDGPPGNATSAAILADPVEDRNTSRSAVDLAEDSATLQQLEESRAETSAELGDFPVEEGDILLQDDRNAVSSIWWGTVIPYTISPQLAGLEWKIHAALRMISDASCIRFKEHSDELSFLGFQDGAGCASYVGQIGGRQPVFISSACSVGNICHEVIHALGFHHEHTRQDRDQYISVAMENIIPKRRRHFKIKYGDTQNLPYDLNSIMHYGQYFFSKNGGQTLMAKVPGATMGQRTHLSQLDMQRLNQLYCDTVRTFCYSVSEGLLMTEASMRGRSAVTSVLSACEAVLQPRRFGPGPDDHSRSARRHDAAHAKPDASGEREEDGVERGGGGSPRSGPDSLQAPGPRTQAGDPAGPQSEETAAPDSSSKGPGQVLRWSGSLVL